MDLFTERVAKLRECCMLAILGKALVQLCSNPFDVSEGALLLRVATSLPTEHAEQAGVQLLVEGHHFGLVRRTPGVVFEGILGGPGMLLWITWVVFSEHSAGLPARTLFGLFLF